VLVDKALVIEAAGAGESNLEAGADIGELPDVGADNLRVVMEQLEAVRDQSSLIILAPADLGVEAPVSVNRGGTKLAHYDRLVGKTKRLRSLVEALHEAVPAVDAALVPALVLIYGNYVAVFETDIGHSAAGGIGDDAVAAYLLQQIIINT